MQEKETNKKMSVAQMDQVAAMFKVLSESARLHLISVLMGGSHTVTELIEATGLKQSNVSKHLKILCDAGLLGKSKEGNYVRYAILEPRLYDLCGLMCAQVEAAAQARVESLKGNLGASY